MWHCPESPAPLVKDQWTNWPSVRLYVFLLMGLTVDGMYSCVGACLCSHWQMWTCLQAQTKLRLLEEGNPFSQGLSGCKWVAQGLPSSHPVEETTMMARGLTSSVSKSVRLPLPSRLELSITSGLESTQNISRRFASTARPSGLTRSAQWQQR